MAKQNKKLQEIHELTAEVFEDVTTDKSKWLAFLKSSSKNYKCNFNEKLLIYFQNPNATAVLTYDEWQENFKRQVKRGAKGIAVIAENETSSKYGYKYYFDIADTYEKRNAIPVPIWRREEADNQTIMDYFKDEYNVDTQRFNTLESAVLNAIDNTVEAQFIVFPDNEVYSNLKRNIKESIEVAVIERLNLQSSNEYTFDGMELLGPQELEELTVLQNQNTEEMLYRLSKALQLEKNKSQNKENEHGKIDLHRNERNFDSRPNEQQQRGTSNWEVRSDENELSQRTQESEMASGSEKRNSPSTSSRSESTGDSTFDELDRANEGSGGDNRRDERSRQPSMGGSDEQHQSESGRNGNIQHSLHVEADISKSPLIEPSVASVLTEERLPLSGSQMSFLSDASLTGIEKGVYEKFSNEELDAVLFHGSLTQGGKLRIREAFATLGTKQELINFVKGEYYYSGGHPMATVNGKNIGMDSRPEGMTLYHYVKDYNNIVDGRPQTIDTIKEVQPWKNIVPRLQYLIEEGKYLSDEELLQYTAEYVFKDVARAEEIPQNFESVDNQYLAFNKLEPVSKICPNNILAEILSDQSGYDDTKEKLYAYFQRGLDDKSNIEFLMQEYGDSVETYPMYTTAEDMESVLEGDEIRYNEEFDSQGYKISKETADGKIETELIEWGKIYEFIQHLMIEGVYVNPESIGSLDNLNREIDFFIERYANNVEIPEIPQEKLEVTQVYPQDFTSYIGETFAYEGRQYIFDSIDKYNASLKDITFQNGTGFPIWRSEPIGWAVEKIEKARAIKKQQELANVKNYEIKDSEIGVGTPRERYKNNISAIKVVHTCESENRTATAEEQEILSKYVGWGGLSEAFDESKWGNEYEELKSLLPENQYKSARASTLTSFYTPPIVIKSMYQALLGMGLEKGNILEPSCGVGNFIGGSPQGLKNGKIYGVEIDELSGKIAKLLYPQSKIQITGFEKASLADNFFDVAIGNVPFGDFKVADSKYDKQNFQIHDYFFAKSLDKVRPSGVVAFITSQGTLDKTSEKFRAYINERAEFLGAIRLPDNTFKNAAGTRVTSDIIFLQKRERQNLADADWIHLSADQNDIEINSYYAKNPHMILGEMKMETGPFGMQANCKAIEGASLEKQLDKAIKYINGKIEPVIALDSENEEKFTIPADPSVRNHSFTIVDGEVFYRQNSEMLRSNKPKATQERIKGMVEIRTSMRDLIAFQLEERSDVSIIEKQKELNSAYDKFVKKYGYISLKANENAFFEDSSYYLLASLEKKDVHDEKIFHKAAMFSERTIKAQKLATKVETSVEALTLSMAEKARVDLGYMAALTDKSKDEIVSELESVIFPVPNHGETETYQTADEYLSGNVRQKLYKAKLFAEMDDKYKTNVSALEKAIPKDLLASEISVRIGATWIEPEYYKEFLFDLFSTGYYAQRSIDVNYYQTTGEWKVTGASYDANSVFATSTYGTKRMNGYKIFENTLNLRDVKIFDTVYDSDNNKKQVLNAKETDIARDKQSAIKEKFIDWIFKDAKRREYLVNKYNEEFNAITLREYNGDHLNFIGMSGDITLRKHQKDAVAHILYGGNTLLAHVVGAGKTFEMIAAAQESKRLGLCNKSMFVVPNHLIDQWATDYMKLYPTANILVTTKKDFETKNRKKFTGKIATGEYDAIIIGHSQFEKIPLSLERQEKELEEQIDEVMQGIEELKFNRGERASIKSLERTKRKLEERLKKLNSQDRKDNVINFEELGVDKLFVDEAHNYKNLFVFTKMTNVGGIAQTEAMKSSDLYMKCRFLDEATNGRGVVFATGTPISNSMVEMYTMQRYLQSSRLRDLGLMHFDSWAANFGETVSAIELSPEGTGYRTKTRFSKFFNLPELMTTFKEIADIKTADMLDLPIPEAHFENVSVDATDIQKREIAMLGERADAVRNREVDPWEDNMLTITNDGRKLALDQRLINAEFPDAKYTKINACVNNVFKIWQDGTGPNSIHGIENTTQLIFSDLSTPKNDGKFNVYDDLREKLVKKGIPKAEIAFIHEAKTDKQKESMFEKVRQGKIRILIGSTSKMGAGTNVQDRLVAIHDLDCPWRPADLEQRAGRIIRQGNLNRLVFIYRYVTKDTFDAYSYQIIEGKQRFIGQVMTSKSVARSADDIDEASLTYAEIKMLATGNPFIKEKMDLDIKINKLRSLKNNHMNEVFNLQDFILKEYPMMHSKNVSIAEHIEKDVEMYKSIPSESDFSITIDGITFKEKELAGKAFLDATRIRMGSREAVEFGSYKGFKLLCEYQPMRNTSDIIIKGNHSYRFERGTSEHGNLQRLDNAMNRIEEHLQEYKEKIINLDSRFEAAKSEVDKPFERQEEFEKSLIRLKEVEALINVENKPKAEYTTEQMQEIEAGEKAGIDTSIYADIAYNAEQMREIRVGLESGLDVSVYANKSRDASIMASIREALEKEQSQSKQGLFFRKTSSLCL